MKTPSPKRTQRGFTLVELLVVISIIAVLAALAFGATNAAMNKAKKVKAQAMETGIQQAIERYYSDYSKLPSVVSGSSSVDTTSQTGVKLITILLGKEESGSTMENPRQVNYLNIQEGKTKKDGGLVYSKSSGKPEGIYDPWGNAFQILFDDDYNDEISDPLKSGNIIRGKICAVYTLGPDKKPGTQDDVKTWN
jgi:prepilin-type N-terminal cleavage/methylation domain-containing protein